MSNAGNSRVSIMQEPKKRSLAVLTLAKGAVIDDAIADLAAAEAGVPFAM